MTHAQTKDSENTMFIPFLKIILGLMVFLLVLFTIAGNLLVCLAVYRCPLLHKPENLFIVNLALSDLLIGIVVMPLAGLYELLSYSWVLGRTTCQIWIATALISTYATIFTLCAISLDRYIHIRDPFRYMNMVTNRVVLAVIALIWLGSAAISVHPVYHLIYQPSSRNNSQANNCDEVFTPSYAIFSSILCFFLPCVLMSYFYCRLYMYSRRHIKRIQSNNPNNISTNDHKAAITIGVILGFFLMCWLPYFTLKIFNLDVPFKVLRFFTWFGYSNSMFNPFVHTAFNLDFRESFKIILKRKFSDPFVNSTRQITFI